MAAVQRWGQVQFNGELSSVVTQILGGRSVLLHGSLLAAYLGAPEPGAEQVGAGGLRVAFGMAGGAPGVAEVVPAEVEGVASPTAPEVEAVPIAMPNRAQRVPGSQPAMEAVTVPETETVPLLPKPAVPPVPVEALAVMPAAPKPAVAAPPETQTKAHIDAQVKTDAGTAPEKAKMNPKPKPASIAGAAGRSGTARSANTGSGASRSQGGKPGARPGYLARLMAWLERHKEYPRLARQRREQGIATLVFTVDRDGRVSNVSISKSSGSAALDREVRAMIARAAPLPRFPDSMRETRLNLAVPVRFSLR